MMKLENNSSAVVGTKAEKAQNTNKTVKKKMIKAFLLCIPMILFTALISIGSIGAAVGPVRMVITVLAYLFMNTLFFLMVYTGKTSKYRTIFFVLLAICFIVSFSANLLLERGTNILNEEKIYGGETPFCQIVLP